MLALLLVPLPAGRDISYLRWWDKRWRLEKAYRMERLRDRRPSSPTSCLPLPQVSAARPFLFLRSWPVSPPGWNTNDLASVWLSRCPTSNQSLGFKLSFRPATKTRSEKGGEPVLPSKGQLGEKRQDSQGRTRTVYGQQDVDPDPGQRDECREKGEKNLYELANQADIKEHFSTID